MRRARARETWLLGAWLAVGTGCPGEVDNAGSRPALAGAAAPGPRTADPVARVPDAKAPTQRDAIPMGRVLPDAPLPLLRILGSEPAVAESHLGDPIAKGGTKTTCVRFVPDRVFFTCKHAWQRYADRTGTFGAVEVRYEDGLAASIAFERVPGNGAFDPRQALAKVGLELPGEPRIDTPASNVRRWSWFNSEARLLVNDRQYRVEVSTVGDAWESAKVDIILNDPLTPAQNAARVPAEPQARRPAEPEPEPAPADG